MTGKRKEVLAMAKRGVRGGLSHEESYQLCGMVMALQAIEDMRLDNIRTLLEDIIDGGHDDDLIEAHGMLMDLRNL